MLKIYNVAKKAETLALTDANELYANGLDTIKKEPKKRNENKTVAEGFESKSVK